MTAQVHGEQGTRRAGSGRTARKSAERPADKPSRTAPPKACTSAESVGVLLGIALDLRAGYGQKARLITETFSLMGSDTSPDAETMSTVRSNLRQLARIAKAEAAGAEVLTGDLDQCQQSLARAERIRDWDDLAGEELTGEAIGAALKDCLDDIRNPLKVGVAIVDARGDLATWFARYDRERLFGKTIAYILGVKRMDTMQREYERWLRFGQAAQS